MAWNPELREGATASILHRAVMMQKSIHAISTVLAIVGLMLASGCGSISTSHTNELVGDRLAPSDPNRVQILDSAPTRKFVKLGEVRVVCDTDEELKLIEKALCKEAAKLGADAVVIAKQGVHVTGGGVTKRVIIGFALKYV